VIFPAYTQADAVLFAFLLFGLIFTLLATEPIPKRSKLLGRRKSWWSLFISFFRR
jgi:hypothetical protein